MIASRVTRFGFVLAAATLLTGIARTSTDAQVAPRASAPLDIVLVGGRVLDPETNLDAVRAVGIKGGRIASVTRTIPAAKDTVDVRGLVVAPGFIDLHSHGQDSVNARFM